MGESHATQWPAQPGSLSWPSALQRLALKALNLKNRAVALLLHAVWMHKSYISSCIMMYHPVSQVWLLTITP